MSKIVSATSCRVGNDVMCRTGAIVHFLFSSTMKAKTKYQKTLDSTSDSGLEFATFCSTDTQKCGFLVRPPLSDTLYSICGPRWS